MRVLIALFFSALLASCASAPSVDVTRSGPVAVAHGGGNVFTVTNGRTQLDRALAYPMSLAGGRGANIVTVKSAETDTDQTFARLFRNAGYRNTTHLTVTDPNAVAQIMAADVIYFDGGVQTGLMRKLNANPDVLAAIKARYAQGAIVAGISAGAAALSDLMICCDRAGRAIPSRGLGLLPDVVIDQHYSERSRQFRLAQIITANPGKIGIGIDEEMAVAFQGNTAQVIGFGGRVTVVRVENGQLMEESFRSGTIDLHASSGSGRPEPTVTQAPAARILPRPLVIEGNRRIICDTAEAVRATVARNTVSALREGSVRNVATGCTLSAESIPLETVLQADSVAPSVTSDGQQLFLTALPDGRFYTIVR